jgi:hypothetical protein
MTERDDQCVMVVLLLKTRRARRKLREITRNYVLRNRFITYSYNRVRMPKEQIGRLNMYPTGVP